METAEEKEEKWRLARAPYEAGLAMPTKGEVVEELNFVTDKLSTQVRTTALGILVFVWGLLVGQSATTLDIAKHWKGHLVGLGGAAIFVMLIDFLQSWLPIGAFGASNRQWAPSGVRHVEHFI